MTTKLGTVSAAFSARFGLAGNLVDSTLGILSPQFFQLFAGTLRLEGTLIFQGKPLKTPFGRIVFSNFSYCLAFWRAVLTGGKSI